jgi:hypothetical protein
MWPWKPKIETALKPGICECGHYRSSHNAGRYACNVVFTAKEAGNDELPPDRMFCCACKIFIRDNGGGGDDPEIVPIDPEVEELKKIAGMK